MQGSNARRVEGWDSRIELTKSGDPLIEDAVNHPTC